MLCLLCKFVFGWAKKSIEEPEEVRFDAVRVETYKAFSIFDFLQSHCGEISKCCLPAFQLGLGDALYMIERSLQDLLFNRFTPCKQCRLLRKFRLSTFLMYQILRTPEKVEGWNLWKFHCLSIPIRTANANFNFKRFSSKWQSKSISMSPTFGTPGIGSKAFFNQTKS